MVQLPLPWLELQRSSSMPLMVLTAASIGLVIVVSISSALAPWQAGPDVDRRRIGPRHQVEAELAVRGPSQHDERDAHHDGEDRPADADISKLHFVSPRWPRRPRLPPPPRRPPPEPAPSPSAPCRSR